MRKPVQFVGGPRDGLTDFFEGETFEERFPIRIDFDAPIFDRQPSYPAFRYRRVRQPDHRDDLMVYEGVR